LFIGAAVSILWLYGGAEARLLAYGVIASTLLTLLAHIVFGIENARYWVLLIDVILLALIVGVVLSNNTHWPIWFAGFHMIAVATGLADALFPNTFPRLYINLAGFWALPALGSAAIGVVLDCRAGTTA
jgi:hypothetical protein